MYPHGEIVYTGALDALAACMCPDALPVGSEGETTFMPTIRRSVTDVTWSVSYRGWLFMCVADETTGNTPLISISGDLRDTGWREDIDAARTWFQCLTASPDVPRAYLQLTVSSLFVCGWYYDAGTLTEITIPDSFCALDD